MSTNHTLATLNQPLENLLATHANQLQAMLGDLWPVQPFKVEQFGPLTKYTLGQMPDGRWAMLHCLSEPDQGPPHCHPCTMESYVIEGSYVECIFQNGHSLNVLRKAGDTNSIAAERIHQIIALPEGEVWTLVKAGSVVREWRHYPELAA